MKLKQIRAWALIGCLLCAASLRSQQSGIVPRLIKFGGEINSPTTQTKGGESAANASPTVVSVTFSLYQLQEGGSSLWSESQKVQVDDQGRYTVLLGATLPEGLPLDLFTSGKALWLGIQPQLPGAVEQPRVLLVAVPYALKAADADTLGGQPASAYALVGSPNMVVAAAGASPDSSSHSVRPDFTTPGGGGTPAPAVSSCSATGDGAGVANQVAVFSGACAVTEASSFVDVGGKVGIGIANPIWPLEVIGNSTSVAGNNYSLFARANWTPSASDTTDAAMGLVLQSEKLGTFDSTAAEGLRGVQANAINGGTGAVTGEAALSGGVQNLSTGVVTNGYGAYILTPIVTAADPITNAYGVYVNGQTITGVTNAYGVYAAGATDANVFMGPVGVATATPTSGFKLEVNGTTKFDGLVTFAAGQTFGSAVTSVTTGAGSGITIGGTATAPTVSADTTVLATNASVATAVTAGELVAEGLSLPLAGGTLTGGLLGTTASFSSTGSFTGALTASGGAILPATAAATSSAGASSNPVDLFASSYNSTSTTAVDQDFRWLAEPAGNNTASPSATLSLQFGAADAAPADTGLSIASNGVITFAPGQTFTGAGTVTSVTGGTGILVTGTASVPIVSADETVLATNASVTTALVPYALSADVATAITAGEGVAEGVAEAASLPIGGGTLTGALTGTTASFSSTGSFSALTASSGDINLPLTTASTAGVINMGGVPLIHVCCNNDGYSNAWLGLGAGNFTGTGSTNTGIGNSALSASTSGSNNTATGADALLFNTTGSNNTAVGYNAGTSASLPTTGSNSTFIGANATATVDGLTDAVAIGNNAQVFGSNEMVLGGTGADAVNVGIGVINPLDTLVINNTSSGVNNIITAQTNGSNVFRVDQAGNAYGAAFNVGGADFAESVAVRGMR